MNPSRADLHALARRDPALGKAMAEVAPFPGFPKGVTARGSHFQALARSIIFQQLAVTAADAIFRRACQLTPGPGFPHPKECAGIDSDVFRSAGLSGAKTKAVKDLALKVSDGTVRLRSIARRSDTEVIVELTQVWGIGEWTAQMFLIFRLGRLNVMPTGDLGVQEGLRRLEGLKERPTPKELHERAEIWTPMKSVATWVLYRLCEQP